MIENTTPVKNVAEIMYRIRDEVIRRKACPHHHGKAPEPAMILRTETVTIGQSNAADNEMSIDEIMAAVQGEVAKKQYPNLPRQALSFPENSDSNDDSVTPFPGCPFLILPDFSSTPGIELKQSYSVNELLSFHDQSFVSCAYKAILSRQPDQAGMESFLSRLRDGVLTKIEVLGRLRYSSEGRRKQINISGLFFPFLVHSSFKIPVIGYILRILVGLAKLPAIIRNIHNLETTLFFHHDQAVETSKNIASQLTVLRGHIAALQDAITESLSQKASSSGVGRIVQNVNDSMTHLAGTIQALGQGVSGIEAREIVLNQYINDKEFRINSSLNEISTTLSAKANAAQLEELNNSVELTGLRTEERFAEIDNALTTKAEAVLLGQLSSTLDIANHRAEVGFKEIYNALALKADAVLFAQLSSAVGVIDERAKTSFTEVQQALAAKAEAIRLEQLNSAVGSMADRTNAGFTEVQQALAAKAEALQLEHLHAQIVSVMESLKPDIQETDLDAMYVAFEDRFRGSREEIAVRQKIYLPYVKKAFQETGGGQILDLGCGRGEWLELLNEHGLKAQGVDFNRVMIEHCRELLLDVVEDDAIVYLQSLPSNSFASVTGMHIIEHIPFKRLVHLFDEVLRILLPKGILILETPNPRNILVGAGDFYRDPTHKQPIFPDSLDFIAETRGFVRHSIFFMKTTNAHIVLEDSSAFAFESINDYINVSRDFAFIGYKA